MGLADQILAIDDRERETLKIPEWNDLEVECRGLSARQIFNINRKFSGDETNDEGFQRELLLAGVYDPSNGIQLFSDKTIDQLFDKSMPVITRLCQKVMQLSGLGEGLEQAEKN